MKDLEFLEESNKIEGILRPPSVEEVAAFRKFMELKKIEIEDLCALVKVFQPDAVIRDKFGLNVRVGNHYPMEGGMAVIYELTDILSEANEYKGIAINCYEVHHAYETLHPFTDGNGRSGRMLWWWMMGGSKLGFLHRWYYQSLEFKR